MAHSGRHNADDQLQLMLACGATLESAARQAGVSLRTAKRRAAVPEFQGKVNTLRRDMVQRAVGMVTAAMAESVKTLVVLQKETIPWSSRLGAARTLLEIGMKLREQNDLEQRLTELEQNVEADRGRKSGH